MSAPLEFHTLANLFPLIEGQEFGALVDDVRERGVLDDIWLLDGKILDGRNRYRAAGVAGRPLDKWQIKTFDPATMGDPLAWVLSRNLHRRHLNESQRAMVAARIATLRQGEKKAAEGADPKPANLPVTPKMDQATAASSLNVSERSVRSAKKVQEQGSPALVAAVEQGKLPVSTAAQAAGLSEPEQAEVVRLAEAGKANPARTVIKKGLRVAKEAALGERQKALPNMKAGVVYADPEWRFEPFSRETGLNNAADNHYPTSPTEEIMARDVPSIAADDCSLFLWATVPMLLDAIRVMEAWGFTYKSHIIWHKERAGDLRGPGYWVTNEHELLLIGTRGHVPAPALGTQFPSVISAPVGVHSEKPEIFAQLIEQYFPTLPKIELNARRARPGWVVWGNEAPDDAGNNPAQNITEIIPAEPVAAVSADDVKALAGDRGPRWLSTLVGPTELSEAEPVAPKPEPAVMEIPAFLLRPQPPKAGGE